MIYEISILFGLNLAGTFMSIWIKKLKIELGFNFSILVLLV
jgi:hypothetical protein